MIEIREISHIIPSHALHCDPNVTEYYVQCPNCNLRQKTKHDKIHKCKCPTTYNVQENLVPKIELNYKTVRSQNAVGSQGYGVYLVANNYKAYHQFRPDPEHEIISLRIGGYYHYYQTSLKPEVIKK